MSMNSSDVLTFYETIDILIIGNPMPIRMIAQELYRVMKEVERVEKALENAPLEKHGTLKDELRKLTAERNRMRDVLEGKKERKFGV